MVSQNEIKQVRRLHQKKYRVADQLFFCEGQKLLKEALASGWQPVRVYATEGSAVPETAEVNYVSAKDMSRMSALSAPPGVLALFRLPRAASAPDSQGWSIFLDDVRDPGNLGTILRIADWFGLRQIVTSEQAVEVFNPKVVQASMGAVFRIPCFTVRGADWLSQMSGKGVRVFGADMKGTALDEVKFPDRGVLVMGSESHGISSELRSRIDEWIAIPGKGAAESLNVAVAAGIICSRIPV